MECKARWLVLMVVAGCTVGAPPGFSNGDHWTFPLVGPLEDGLLITPVSVRGHGPYLFVIDPDANVTAIDQQVVSDAELRTGDGPRVIDETDTSQNRLFAELVDLKVANLTVDRRDVLVFSVGFYDTESRHVSGILGRDVLSDSLVFGFDRDQGLATLSTVKAFTPPPGANAINYQLLSSRADSVATRLPPSIGALAPGSHLETLRPASPAMTPTPAGGALADFPDMTPVQRRIATAQIGEARFAMHLDLGAVVSQLSESSWSTAHMAPVEIKLRLVDEAVTVRNVTRAGVAAEVTLGTTKARSVMFAPFIEKRFGKTAIDGALGLNFFRAYAVYANWDSKTYYVKPRGDATAMTTARLGRWGADLPACPHLGCVTTELVATGAGVTLNATRDARAANYPLEVLLGVTLAAGISVAPLVLELPSGTDKIADAVPASYAGATLTVLDVAPFPRPCTGNGGCMFSLGSQGEYGAEPSPQGPPPPRLRRGSELAGRSRHDCASTARRPRWRRCKRT